jgi:hypothetical protein
LGVLFLSLPKILDPRMIGMGPDDVAIQSLVPPVAQAQALGREEVEGDRHGLIP